MGKPFSNGTNPNYNLMQDFDEDAIPPNWNYAREHLLAHRIGPERPLSED